MYKCNYFVALFQMKRTNVDFFLMMKVHNIKGIIIVDNDLLTTVPLFNLKSFFFLFEKIT